MEAHQQYTLDSLERSQRLIDATPELETLKGTQAYAQLGAAITAVNTQHLQQGTATLELEGVKNRQKSLATVLRDQHMAPLAKFARANLAGVPDYKALAVSTKGLRGKKLVAAAEAQGNAAKPYVTQLTAAQFPADTIDQLLQAAAAVQAALVDRATASSTKVGAAAGIKQYLKSGRGAVKALDASVEKMLAGNATLLAEWRQAKRVVKKPGGPGTAVVAPAPTTPPKATPTPAVATIAPSVVAQEVKTA